MCFDEAAPKGRNPILWLYEVAARASFAALRVKGDGERCGLRDFLLGQRSYQVFRDASALAETARAPRRTSEAVSAMRRVAVAYVQKLPGLLAPDDLWRSFKVLAEVLDDGAHIRAAGGAKPTKIAMALGTLSKHPGWSTTKIASEVGCSREYIQRDPTFKSARAVQAEARRDQARCRYYDKRTGEYLIEDV